MMVAIKKNFPHNDFPQFQSLDSLTQAFLNTMKQYYPQDNPYINYAALYAKDFPKSIDKDSWYGVDRMLSANSLKIPYDINYDFVKAMLLQISLNESGISLQYDKSLAENLSNLEPHLPHKHKETNIMK